MGVRFYWEKMGKKILVMEIDQKTLDDFKHMLAMITSPVWGPLCIFGAIILFLFSSDPSEEH